MNQLLLVYIRGGQKMQVKKMFSFGSTGGETQALGILGKRFTTEFIPRDMTPANLSYKGSNKIFQAL